MERDVDPDAFLSPTAKHPHASGRCHSGPCMHDGAFDTLESVVELYRRSSDAQRAGALRNGAAELSDVVVSGEDAAPLAAFLRALNEDYE